jgi:hypothetical protein
MNQIDGRDVRRRLLVCSVAFVALTVAGCGSKSSGSNASASSTTAGSSTSVTYPAGKEAVCQARDQLKTSVTALTKPALLVGGSAAVKAAVDQVQTNLESLKTAAKSDYQPQVDAVQTAVQTLKTDVGNLGDGAVAQNLQTVGTDIATVGTTTSDLFTQLKTSCGS